MRAALLALLLLAGCAPAQAERQTHPTQEWRTIPMSGGPAVYTACVGTDRLYALQSLASRARQGLWPGASIAVVRGGC